MNSPSPIQPVSSVPTVEPAAQPVSTGEIDASCRAPVLYLFVSALAWLLIGLALALVASIKLHGPDFLGNTAWLTYGRVVPAFGNVLVYGFASPAALGVALWLIARLGRTRLWGAAWIVVATVFWNLGVLVGLAGILAGHSTGYAGLEMPLGANSILFFSYLLIGLGAVLTFHDRKERRLYVSQWYLLAALLWFPWIFSTANLLLLLEPVRGVLQAAISSWFVNCLTVLWLTPVGLGAIFYFIPKVTGRPLHSHYLGLFGFWLLAIFGGWGGLYAGAPLPSWLNSLSIVTTVLLIVPVLAVTINWRLTMAGQQALFKTSPTLRFIAFGAASYTISGLLTAASAWHSVSETVQFTHFTTAVAHLTLFGFFAMTLFGAVYYVTPRLVQAEWPSAKMVQVHFWCSAAGITLYVISLAFGGVLQGLALNNASRPFLESVRSILPFVGMSTLGLLVLAAGQVALLANLGLMLGRACCACCRPADWFAGETKRAEARV